MPALGRQATFNPNHMPWLAPAPGWALLQVDSSWYGSVDYADLLQRDARRTWSKRITRTIRYPTARFRTSSEIVQAMHEWDPTFSDVQLWQVLHGNHRFRTYCATEENGWRVYWIIASEPSRGRH